jgi:hypothetical protein
VLGESLNPSFCLPSPSSPPFAPSSSSSSPSVLYERERERRVVERESEWENVDAGVGMLRSSTDE